MLYITTIHLIDNAPSSIVRYPITGIESNVPSFAKVMTTTKAEKRRMLNDDWEIDETVEPYIVDKDGNRATLDAEGTMSYQVKGNTRYCHGKDVDVEFIPEDNFLGTADGISIRRSDNNGYNTGWYNKIPRSRTKH